MTFCDTVIGLAASKEIVVINQGRVWENLLIDSPSVSSVIVFRA